MGIEEPAAVEAEGGGKKGGGSKKWLIIGAAAVVLLGGGTFAFLKLTGGPAEEHATPEDAAKEKAEEAVQQSGLPGTMFPIESFIVNLAGSEGKRFLKVTIDMELDKAQVADEAKARLPQIKDSILVLLSSKTFEEVYTVQGKFKLRDEIISRTNSFLKTGKVKNIYFTEFVIQ